MPCRASSVTSVQNLSSAESSSSGCSPPGAGPAAALAAACACACAAASTGIPGGMGICISAGSIAAAAAGATAATAFAAVLAAASLASSRSRFALPVLGAAGVFASTADCSGVSQMCCFFKQCASPFFLRMQSGHRSGTSSPAPRSTAPTDSETTNLPFPPRRAATRGTPSGPISVPPSFPAPPPAPCSPAPPKRFTPCTTCPLAAQYEMPLCDRAQLSHRCAQDASASETATAAACFLFLLLACAPTPVVSGAQTPPVSSVFDAFLFFPLPLPLLALGGVCCLSPSSVTTTNLLPNGCGSERASTPVTDSRHKRKSRDTSPSSNSTSCVNASVSNRETRPR
mmetsp:Transcript_2064/g.7982  ORF Transcript_2064/g.7982 Transcript_2064/m.7982 type:complete len:342 (-) Transcript_2064:3317-4342(-)